MSNVIILFFCFMAGVSGLNTIQVCQNKNCCRRFTGKAADLVQTLRQITTGYEIESTGCLSQCDNGPNICIDGTVENGIDSAAVAAAVLEINKDTTIHPTFLAACQVMEKAERATSLAEKERNLSSVISALMKLEGESKKCLAQALVMRAHLALDYRDASLEQARDDAHSASRLDPQHATVWRVLADVEMKLGNSSQAIEALHKWAKYQPKFVTKVNQELQRIS
eukprot:CAMPEP_0194200182 /NCGR_PEP_ID=MMETSP0156-20130528/900_1 /TAXON_ID=33649 /ORGANISM="Thalassionema nitzschioides, Strain L26-B" /LENGTH=223 /DNA_ID=CAMNT_0038925149 /DNA_START=90 /DNA_END=761 /DNA_ORIENTATION=-